MRALLAVLVLLITGTAAFSQQPEQFQPIQQQTITEQCGAERAPLVIKLLPTAKTHQEAAQEARDRKQKAKQDRISLLFTGMLTLFTALLFASTVALWRTTAKTTKATNTLAGIARTQLKDQQAIQRAYVSAEAEGLHPLLGDTRAAHFVVGHVNFVMEAISRLAISAGMRRLIVTRAGCEKISLSRQSLNLRGPRLSLQGAP